ncbi:MAG: adenylate/guanylate cyclase domain-containing protein [Caldilineaceae bacterium]|nr:adenylate/guanylate cyclase domain-containing protein [Caldilineaceae bacterium]
MLLDEVLADLTSQLDAQAELGVQIMALNEVPEEGPVNRGLWFQIPNVTAVFVDLKRSTELSADSTPKTSAFSYTYFIRAMVLIFERFGSDYIDIHGDGVFALFSGPQSEFCAVASAVTARTQVERDIAVRFEKDTSTEWKLTAGVGIDRGTLLVRRLGLRGAKQNEVWAGKPVNMAAKLSSVACSNQVVVSERVFSQFRKASPIRRRALLRDCGCCEAVQGNGLDASIGETKCLWTQEPAPGGMGLDFGRIYRSESEWCCVHGPEFCETIVSGCRPGI